MALRPEIPRSMRRSECYWEGMMQLYTCAPAPCPYGCARCAVGTLNQNIGDETGVADNLPRQVLLDKGCRRIAAGAPYGHRECTSSAISISFSGSRGMIRHAAAGTGYH